MKVPEQRNKSRLPKERKKKHIPSPSPPLISRKRARVRTPSSKAHPFIKYSRSTSAAPTTRAHASTSNYQFITNQLQNHLISNVSSLIFSRTPPERTMQLLVPKNKAFPPPLEALQVHPKKIKRPGVYTEDTLPYTHGP